MFGRAFDWSSIVLFLAAATTVLAVRYFSGKRLVRYLQYFQQEDYDNQRFFKWLEERGAHDRKGSIVALLAVVLTALALPAPRLNAPLALTFSLLAALRLYFVAKSEPDPTKTGKITLKITPRAERICSLALRLCTYVDLAATVSILVIAGPLAVPFVWLCQIAIVQMHPLFLTTANAMLAPEERKHQEEFADQARAVLKAVHPTVIGITGSYGKTSTKVILTEILNSVAPTFTTPRSINSYMGVTRELRERLKPHHKYAVIEMGAYHTGSIKRMCSLTPPAAAIVTAVGEMHLERFGSEENVYLAKSELPQAVPKEGILVVNGDYAYARKMATVERKENTYIYGMDESKGEIDALMFDMRPTDKGTEFSIKWKDQVYRGFTPLLGQPMLANALAAFTMSAALGLNPDLILAVLRNVKTESNRLELVRASIASLAQVNGAPPREGTIIRLNDAFNSNPQGFKGALEVLSQINGARKILVTPGMIELGDKQYDENRAAAINAARCCDRVVLVGKTNRDALADGLKAGGLADEKCTRVDSMKEAFKFLAHEYCQDGDVVLIENDLPDLYESAPVF